MKNFISKLKIFSFLLIFPLAALSSATAQILYVTDQGNDVVTSIDQSGNATTVASFDSPYGIVASGGNLYVADSTDDNVYQVDSSGNVTTYASSVSGGNGSLSGMAMDSSGNLYVGDNVLGTVYEIDSSGNVTTAYSTGDYISDLAYYGNNLYEAGIDTIYKGNSSYLTFSQFTPFDAPTGITGIAFDSSGDLFVAGTYRTGLGQIHSEILEYSHTGVTTTFFNLTSYNGSEWSAGLAFYNGNLYVGEQDLGDIIEITPGGVGSVFYSDGQDGFAPQDLTFEVTPEPQTYALLIAGAVFLVTVSYFKNRRSVS